MTQSPQGPRRSSPDIERAFEDAISAIGRQAHMHDRTVHAMLVQGKTGRDNRSYVLLCNAPTDDDSAYHVGGFIRGMIDRADQLNHERTALACRHLLGVFTEYFPTFMSKSGD